MQSWSQSCQYNYVYSMMSPQAAPSSSNNSSASSIHLKASCRYKKRFRTGSSNPTEFVEQHNVTLMNSDMDLEIARMCDIVKTFPCINAALELYFLLNSDRKLWVLDKPTLMPVYVMLKDNLRKRRRSRRYSLKISQPDGAIMILTESKEDIKDALVFNASVIDLQHLVRRIASRGGFESEEVVKDVELGGQLDLRINGTTLSRQEMLQIIEERIARTAGLDSQVEHSVSVVDTVFPDKVMLVLDQEANPKKITSYSSDGRRVSSHQETLTGSIDEYINWVFGVYPNIQEVVVVDSVTRTMIISKKRGNRIRGPPACNLGGDKIELVTSEMSKRKDKPRCSTMTRCLCVKHCSFPCTVMMFYDSIVKACGDVAMKRGDCPMCCVKPNTRSKKPLVRFTEEVDWTQKSGHDWSDFQFRGMLFEMFPNSWTAVENAVYRDKSLVVSTSAGNALNKAIATDMGVEDVLRSNELRPWPLYEMAISASHGHKAHRVAMHYLDLALGHVFFKGYKERLADHNPNVIRILVSAAQLITDGDCLLDDTRQCKPFSRSGDYTIGCLVCYKSGRGRVLAEQLRTWGSVEWKGDIAQYLTSLYEEKFRAGALGFYFNTDRTIGVKIEMLENSLHVTSIICNIAGETCDLCKKREDKRDLESKLAGLSRYP